MVKEMKARAEREVREPRNRKGGGNRSNVREVYDITEAPVVIRHVQLVTTSEVKKHSGRFEVKNLELPADSSLPGFISL